MPKSRSFTSPLRRHEDVRRLEIAVDDEPAVGVVDRGADAEKQLDALPRARGPCASQ